MQFVRVWASKTHPKHYPKPHQNSEKNKSKNDMFFDVDFFTFWGIFWELLGRSWASLGTLWAPKWRPGAKATLGPGSFFFALVILGTKIGIFTDLGCFGGRFGRVRGGF